MSAGTSSATRSGPAVAPLLGLGVAAGVGLVLAHLLLGRSALPASEVVDVLLRRTTSPAAEIIVLDYRLPRVLVGLGAGALLAVSGVLVQAVVRNPLAEPSTTGVGAGAAFAVVLSGVWWPQAASPYVAALLGALVTGTVLYALGRRAFALVGVLLGAVLAAGTSLLLVLDSAPLATVLRWLVGSLNARTPTDWTLLWPWLLMLLPLGWLLSPWLNVWALGESAAVGLGARPGPLVAVVLLAAVAAAGAAIAAAGAVAFIGLAAPHVARLVVGTDHRRLVPVAAVVGALLLSAADLAAFSVSLGLPGVATDVSGVPVGAVTALLGAPLLIGLLRREGRS